MATITECIQSANRTIRAVGSDFTKAVKCSGIVGEDFSCIFEVKEDNNVRNALSEFRNERVRVEQQISDINRKISNAQATIDEMNSKIRACDNNNYSSQIRTASSDMDRYRKEMDRATDKKKKEEYSSLYQQAKKKKEQAESSKRTNDNNRENHVNQKKSAEKTKSELNGSRNNLEKRLNQVNEIISLF